MTRIVFRDAQGGLLRGAVVAITAAPDEITDIGYITDDTGSIVFTPPAAGDYVFAVNAPDGTALHARTRLAEATDGDADVTAVPA